MILYDTFINYYCTLRISKTEWSNKAIMVVAAGGDEHRRLGWFLATCYHLKKKCWHWSWVQKGGTRGVSQFLPIFWYMYVSVAARNVRFVYWGRLSYCLFVWIYVVVSILKSPLGSLAALQTEPPNWKMFNHVGLQPAMILGPQTFLSNPSSHHPILPSSWIIFWLPRFKPKTVAM